jgi:hypothetical protein
MQQQDMGSEKEHHQCYLDVMWEFQNMKLKEQIQYIKKSDWHDEHVPLGVPIKLEIHKHPLNE